MPAMIQGHGSPASGGTYPAGVLERLSGNHSFGPFAVSRYSSLQVLWSVLDPATIGTELPNGAGDISFAELPAAFDLLLLSA